jgi:CO/xanthine dehydrogenase Mo-binding subunit
MASDRVRFIGEEVAAVAADSAEIAEEALSLIDVRYEELDVVFDPEEAMRPDSPNLYEGVENNIAVFMPHEYGDVEKAFEEADYLFEDEFKTQPQYHAPMERQGCVCNWDVQGNLTMWTCTQTPHLHQWMLATIMGIPVAKTRIVTPYVGGGFGAKAHQVFPFQVISAVLAKKIGKPVKIELTRKEDFSFATASPPFIVKLKTGVNKDGKITARQIRVIESCGAHLYISAGQLLCSIYFPFGHLYKVPNLKYEGCIVYSNSPNKAVALRGFGSPQGTFPIESQMDTIAEKLNMDPVELKTKNLFEQGETSVAGWKFDSYGLPECIKQASEAAEWNKKRKERAPNRGIGMACMIHSCGFKGAFGSIETSSAIITAKEDGTFNLYTDFSEIGTGVWTVVQEVAAETIGTLIDNIQVTGGDTAVTPFDMGSFASRGTFSVGNAVKLASEDIRAQLFEVAADMLEAGIDDLEAKNGEVYVKGSPGKKLSIAEVTNHAIFELGKSLISKGIWNSPAGLFDPFSGVWPNPGPTPSYPFACHIAEVEVDPQTGKVKVLSVTAAHDVGYPINLDTVEGQIHGGVMMGLGYALSENLVFEDGKVLCDDFVDYFIRRAPDLPKINPIVVSTDDPYGPFGAKGIGETVMIPTAPAIANAIYHAVGVRIKELPITPEKILNALREKQGNK